MSKTLTQNRVKGKTKKLTDDFIFPPSQESKVALLLLRLGSFCFLFSRFLVFSSYTFQFLIHSIFSFPTERERQVESDRSKGETLALSKLVLLKRIYLCLCVFFILDSSSKLFFLFFPMTLNWFLIDSVFSFFVVILFFLHSSNLFMYCQCECIIYIYNIYNIYLI